MRIIAIDTETTGLHPHLGHRIIEIGCVEIINRQITGEVFHTYINPQRKIEEGAFKVHGISDEMVADKPLFSEIICDLDDFFCGSELFFPPELIMHNARFDIGFINNELKITGHEADITDFGVPICTREMSKRIHNFPSHSLDALKDYYKIDIKREKHGALIDAEILAHVYLKMTESWYV